MNVKSNGTRQPRIKSVYVNQGDATLNRFMIRKSKSVITTNGDLRKGWLCVSVHYNQNNAEICNHSNPD